VRNADAFRQTREFNRRPMRKNDERKGVNITLLRKAKPACRSDRAAAALGRWGRGSPAASPVVVGGWSSSPPPACRSGRERCGGWGVEGRETRARRGGGREARTQGGMGTTPHGYSRRASGSAPIAVTVVRAALCWCGCGTGGG
jgi:hypothetical protein